MISSTEQSTNTSSTPVTAGSGEPKKKKPLKLKANVESYKPDAQEEIALAQELNITAQLPMMGAGQLSSMHPMPKLLEDLKTGPSLQRSQINSSSQAFQPSEYAHMPTLEEMYAELTNDGLVQVNPLIYNQVSPGIQAPIETTLHPDLQDFITGLTEDDYQLICEQVAEATRHNHEHSFGEASHHRTYSDIDPEEDYEAMFDKESDDEDNKDMLDNVPGTWEADPEAIKRREEVKKSIFSPAFAHCECCKGYVSNCSGQVCKSLGICHCVVRKEQEDPDEEKPINEERIDQFKNCTCCSGFIHKCACVNAGREHCSCVE